MSVTLSLCARNRLCSMLDAIEQLIFIIYRKVSSCVNNLPRKVFVIECLHDFEIAFDTCYDLFDNFQQAYIRSYINDLKNHRYDTAEECAQTITLCNEVVETIGFALCSYTKCSFECVISI